MVKKNFLMTAPLLMASFCSAQEKPNVVLIMVDDMGYSDIGCYGGEILTPNIDALASKGVRFTQFYNTSRSCPARASLMTGLYQHQAGIGQIAFFVIPFLQSTVIEHLQIVLNDERNDIVFQALLKHDQPAHTAVAVLERMNPLKLHMEV